MGAEAVGDVEARVRALFAAVGVVPVAEVHGAVRGVDSAAAARGLPAAAGGKALVMKLEGLGPCVVALRGDRALDGPSLRRALGVGRYRFARPEELAAWTGCAPGAVPPFGPGVFPGVALVADESLRGGGLLAFTPGVAERSLRVDAGDWARAVAAAGPVVWAALSRPREGSGGAQGS